jgi:transcription elongation factor Elf1
VAVAEELLWHKTCAQCHAISVTPLPDVKIARWNVVGEQRNRAAESHASADRVETNLPVIAAARTRLQWLPHARFDHDAHTGFSCESCHQNAVTSTESSDILIPGIATCQKCHAQGSDRAESRCFECHTYHDWAQRKEVKAAFTLPALRQHP